MKIPNIWQNKIIENQNSILKKSFIAIEIL